MAGVMSWFLRMRMGVIHVPAAVADEPGLSPVDVKFFHGEVYQVGGRFPAFACLDALVVGAVIDFGELYALFCQLAAHIGMHPVHVLAGVDAFRHAALVGDDKEQVAGILQAFHAFHDAGIENKVFRFIDVIMPFIGIDGAVAVKEHGFV